MSEKAPAFRRGCAALGRAARALLDHRNPRDAAAVSYFSFFALFPAAMILIAVANEILGRFKLENPGIIKRIIALFPISRKFLNENIGQIVDPSTTLVLSCIIIVLWTSSWIFSIVENAMNRAWDLPKRRTFWESRLRSITVVVVGGSIMIGSVFILAIVSPATFTTAEEFRAYEADPIIHWLWQSVLLIIVLLLAFLVFFSIFKLMPDKQVSWKEALSGALLAAPLWELASFGFVKLMPYFDYERIYGTMGAVIALLAWVYTSNVILLFGTNFSAQLHRRAAEQTLGLGPAASGAQEAGSAGLRVRSFPSSR